MLDAHSSNVAHRMLESGARFRRVSPARGASNAPSDHTSRSAAPRFRLDTPSDGRSRRTRGYRKRHRRSRTGSSRSFRRRSRLRSSAPSRRWCRRWDSNPHDPRPRDFKSRASANSATSADVVMRDDCNTVFTLQSPHARSDLVCSGEGCGATAQAGTCWNW